MSPREILNKNGAAIIAALVSFAFGYGMLRAEVNSKASATDFTLHVEVERAELQEVRSIVLDLLCSQQPAHRRCR